MKQAGIATEQKQSRFRIVRRRFLLILFGLALSWLLIEAFLRVGFDLLPPKVQGDIQQVRRVPWSEETIIPIMPFLIDRDFQVRMPVGLKDFPVRWSDARFTYNTIGAWEGHRAGLRSDLPRWPLDILTFGDSFTWCWTKIEDCWVRRLDTDHGYNIFNAAIPGTGTTGQLNLMKELAGPMNPKLVIWAWYNNDISDNYDLARIRGEVEDLQGAPASDPVLVPSGLGSYSALYWLVSGWLNPPPKISPYRHFQNVVIDGRTMLMTTNEFPYASSQHWPRSQYGWKRGVEAFTEGKRFLREEVGAKLLIVIIPTKEEVFGDIMEKVIGREYLNQMGETRGLLMKLCQEHNWHCLDATTPLQEAARKGQTVYYGFDSHLDPSGNKLLADLVYDYVVKNGLLAGK